MNPDSSPKTRASPRGHSKTKSVPNAESPLSGQLGTTPKKPFPSTFTAFNLALPTTPTPLPMHTSQFDNTSGRKGRRITIEHDIDILMGEYNGGFAEINRC
jgi:centromeric protein E